jgi:IS5 family transposase
LRDAKQEVVVVVVDCGCKGIVVDEVKICHLGPRMMVRRRSTIEPAICHMKAGGKLDRNWLSEAHPAKVSCQPSEILG